MNRRRSIIYLTAIFAMVGIMLTPGVMAAPKSGKPALITSAGQSTDGLILRTILTDKKTGDTVPFEKLAKPEDLEGIRTLIVSVGLSTKGLGAAGVMSIRRRQSPFAPRRGEEGRHLRNDGPHRRNCSTWQRV